MPSSLSEIVQTNRASNENDRSETSPGKLVDFDKDILQETRRR